MNYNYIMIDNYEEQWVESDGQVIRSYSDGSSSWVGMQNEDGSITTSIILA